MKKILFLCTGNSCRSQIAEGLANNIFDSSYNIESAGTERHGVNPNAIKTLKEIGIDISNYKSKSINLDEKTKHPELYNGIADEDFWIQCRKEELLERLSQNTICCKNVSFRIFGFSLASINTIFSFLLFCIFIKIYKNYEINK